MSCSEAIEKEANAPRERWCHWHWQNLNKKWPKGADRSERCGKPKLGWGLRAGRCWWHFPGCSWEMLPSETPEQALRRMESMRKFT